MSIPAQTRLILLICLALVLGIVATYGPVISYDFVNYDDPSYVTDNPYVQGAFTPQKLVWAFTTFHTGYWHPLTWLSIMLDCQLYGVHPGGLHLTNLLLHIANTLLLFLVLRKMTGSIWRSGVVAALFAWHPLHVESVAWIAERKDVLSAFFWLLTMWLYAGYVNASRDAAVRASNSERNPEAPSPAILRWSPTKFYLLTLSAFGLAVLSKPMVVTLPCALLLLDYWPLRRAAATNGDSSGKRSSATWFRLMVEKAPFFLLAAMLGVVTLLGQQETGALIPLGELSFTERIANALVSYVRYLGKTIWPSHLVMFYSMPDAWPAWQVAGAVSILVIFTLLAWLCRERWPYLLTGWFWFLGTLVPVIGFVHVGLQALADRYTYIPSIGLFIIPVWGLADIAARWSAVARRGLEIATALILAACLVLTWFQVRTWRNSFTLFNHLADEGPDRAVALEFLGGSYVRLNRFDDAVAQYKAAAQAAPRSPIPPFYLGWLAARRGNTALAMNYFQQALANDPDYSAAHFEIANLLANQGKLAEAVPHYQASIRAYPRAVEARYNFGKVLALLGSFPEAAEQFKVALQLDPESAETHDQLGSVLQKLGQIDEAKAHYAEAVRLKPDFIHPRLKLGLILAEHGQPDEARAQFVKVLEIEPTNDVAFYNLGGLDAVQGRFPEAAAAFGEAARLQPNDADIHARLGGVLVLSGKYEEAIAQYREAMRLKPDWPEPMRALAELLATSRDPQWRNGAEAVLLAEHARELTVGRDLGVLAALDEAYAEAGRFNDAIQTAEELRKLAVAGQQKEIAEAAAHRLDLYRAGKAYHE
jgi:tetratricopeptide (TPR) repeat protein